MLTAINLVDNSEKTISSKNIKDIGLQNTWIDIKNPTQEEMKSVTEKLDVPLSLLLPSAISTYANISFHEDNVIIYFTSINGEFDPKNIFPVILMFSKNFLLSIRMMDIPAIGRAKQRLHKHKADSPAYVAYSVLEEIIEDYYVYLEIVEDRTRALEETILEKAKEQTLKDLFRLKSKLISFNKILWYERGVLFTLKKSDISFLTLRQRNLFDDLHDDLTKQVDIVETFREILSDALDAYLSTVSNKINTSIKKLTIVMLYLTIFTTLTAFPNTIATIFGIPVFGTSTDWRIILALLVISAIVPALWLLKKKWVRIE